MKNLIKALVKFQKEVKDPTKDASNIHFKSKYVPLDGLIKAVRPTLVDNGLTIVMSPITEDERVGVATTLIHESGETMEFPPFTFRLQKNDAQGAGSAITYARRYAMSAILGLAWDEDDDGNEACKSVHKPVESTQKQQTKSRKTELANTINGWVKEGKITSDEVTETIHQGFNKKSFNELTEQEATQLFAVVAKNVQGRK